MIKWEIVSTRRAIHHVKEALKCQPHDYRLGDCLTALEMRLNKLLKLEPVVLQLQLAEFRIKKSEAALNQLCNDPEVKIALEEYKALQ